MNFGAALKSAREEAKLLQAELAEKADLDVSYISMLERNKKSPTLTVYFRLCKVLSVLPSDLMKKVESGDAETPPPKSPRKKK